MWRELPNRSSRADMIPKIIHYCWFGNKEPNAEIQECMASWARLLPDYRIVRWNESNSPMEEPYVKFTYRQGLYAKVSNYVRLYALDTQGGIYLDTDIEVIKNFDPLLHDDAFIGFEQRHWVNNAVLGAIPHHPYIKTCIDVTLSVFAERKRVLRSPELSTMVLKQLGLKRYGMQLIGGVHIYPLEYFFPYPWWAQYHPVRIKPTTYTIHRWQRSSYDMTKFPMQLKLRAALYQLQSHAQAQMARLGIF